MVVVMNKIDVISPGSGDKVNGATSTNNGSRDQLTMTNGKIDSQSDAFLCCEMVESLVTCDWGHGFVSASAKDNVNVVQVRIYFWHTVKGNKGALCYYYFYKKNHNSRLKIDFYACFHCHRYFKNCSSRQNHVSRSVRPSANDANRFRPALFCRATIISKQYTILYMDLMQPQRLPQLLRPPQQQHLRRFEALRNVIRVRCRKERKKKRKKEKKNLFVLHPHQKVFSNYHHFYPSLESNCVAVVIDDSQQVCGSS